MTFMKATMFSPCEPAPVVSDGVPIVPRPYLRYRTVCGVVQGGVLFLITLLLRCHFGFLG